MEETRRLAGIRHHRLHPRENGHGWFSFNLINIFYQDSEYFGYYFHGLQGAQWKTSLSYLVDQFYLYQYPVLLSFWSKLRFLLFIRPQLAQMHER